MTSTLEYKWPTLATEGKEMIASAILMYGLADLRALARKGQLTKGDPAVNERILNLPATVDDVVNAATANEDALTSNFSKEEHDMYGKALLSLQSSLQKVEAESGDSLSQELVVYDDENQTNELVYGIEINHARKRITVGFRGSVTVKDFMVDAKAYLCDIPNPLEPDSGKLLGIHHGFYEYLYVSDTSGKGPKKDCKSDVITNQVAALFEKYQGYRLYTTGHSLGAALAVLFGANAAASKDPRIPKPVSVICIACPKVGNRAFLKAFKMLESQGLIRCLRIQNYRDAVTFLPDRGRDLTTCSLCERHHYKHVGLALTLDKDGAHAVAYPKDEGGKFQRLMKNWSWYCGHDLGIFVTLPVVMWYNREFLRNHSVTEYTARFDKFSELNEELYLNDIYRKDVPDCDSDFGI